MTPSTLPADSTLGAGTLGAGTTLGDDQPTTPQSAAEEANSAPAGGRVQLALNVSDVDAVVDFDATLYRSH